MDRSRSRAKHQTVARAPWKRMTLNGNTHQAMMSMLSCMSLMLRDRCLFTTKAGRMDMAFAPMRKGGIVIGFEHTKQLHVICPRDRGLLAICGCCYGAEPTVTRGPRSKAEDSKVTTGLGPLCSLFESSYLDLPLVPSAVPFLCLGS
ncbi:hypothetical protein BAUCODRAFT_235241 [Baudoinia panamericana UAMH 10762]|uniref:Uncharacterized protein n=1 Tax=Baudoinia panamericana (strain UAMH 10762) TaxID=717646 RepID=M2LGR8_BAUPA|nr:uncharacterized protein BAUCODRAFT_235241 [Baudoinia panamericana UAMH 10762]EMC93297.1 hypothetical protein BAUCODRAFT_235241 [Baudoinia panamericana UAMH 10762]